MTIEILTGGVAGQSRAELVTKAKEVASAYFGTPCVVVRLRDAEGDTLSRDHSGAVTSVTFKANFDAQEHHDVRGRTYGPDQCRTCDRDSWPHDPLRRADWSVVDKKGAPTDGVL
ncbi:hypothetical protein [Microbacterium sp. NPDC089696]|uniref:hypothetical protein n=1 Tax=Microbacterium sp. NPDC089696 TaxID=3364199 RepID=UPI00381AA5E7